VFFHEKEKTVEAEAALRSYLVERNRQDHVTIVNIPRPRSLTAIRNSWVPIPGFVEMLRRSPKHVNFFLMLDDDTYALMNGIRRVIAEVSQNTTATAGPLYIGAPQEFGKYHGWLVQKARSGKRTILPSSKRKYVKYVCGGAGILVNRHSLNLLEPFAEQCAQNGTQPAGDIRVGYCFQFLNISVTSRYEMVKVSWFRAIGDLQVDKKRPFPASFHWVRKRSWFYAMFVAEEQRRPNKLVSWEDIRRTFPLGPLYTDWLFNPSRYSNYSLLKGVKPKSARELQKAEKRRQFLKRHGFAVEADEDDF